VHEEAGAGAGAGASRSVGRLPLRSVVAERGAERADVAEAREVDAVGHEAGAGALEEDLVANAARLGEGAADDVHGRAPTREASGDRAADARARAGDDRREPARV
jgi:hypothetical protein